ncbi:hypothetical protein CC80DRAFT_468692 [Byssothecium circinans]|uniref:SET domain-containing protein n=1 Tax=Byssothecium circinans TaxID=147558 RepID=A0A6A5U157_9PLEO|nr:hypothetical protein CC80DRAFT_468692 [Byssothecium circinans]
MAERNRNRPDSTSAPTSRKSEVVDLTLDDPDQSSNLTTKSTPKANSKSASTERAFSTPTKAPARPNVPSKLITGDSQQFAILITDDDDEPSKASSSRIDLSRNATIVPKVVPGSTVQGFSQKAAPPQATTAHTARSSLSFEGSKPNSQADTTGGAEVNSPRRPHSRQKVVSKVSSPTPEPITATRRSQSLQKDAPRTASPGPVQALRNSTTYESLQRPPVPIRPSPPTEPSEASTRSKPNDPASKTNEANNSSSEKPRVPTPPPPKPAGTKARKSAPSAAGVAVKLIRPPTLSKNAPFGLTKTTKPRLQPLTSVSAASVAGPSRESITERPHSMVTSTDHNIITNTQIVDSQDLDQTKACVDECVKKHLHEVYRSHAYMVSVCLRRNRECFERELRSKERLSMHGVASATSPDKYLQNLSPFKQMLPIQVPIAVVSGDKQPYLSEEPQNIKFRSKEVSKMAMKVTAFRSEAIDIPTFREYVSLQDNILSENQNELLNWPYFVNDEITTHTEQSGLVKALEKAYKLRNDKTHLLDDINRFYASGTDTILSELGIRWTDVLFWLLGSDDDIRSINRQGLNSKHFEKPLLDRNPQLVEGSNQERLKWGSILSLLPAVSSHQLRLTALACSAFLIQSTFKIWHLALRSDFIQRRISRMLLRPTESPQFEYRSTVCRVCQVHDCLSHGELREDPDGVIHDSQNSQSEDSDSDNDETPLQPKSSRTAPVVGPEHGTSDSDIEEVINYKRIVNAHSHHVDSITEGDTAAYAIPPPGEFDAKWWLTKTNTTNWVHWKPFYPCYHPGSSCITANCRCYREGITCEKSCTCPSSCNRRFPGCSCASNTGKQRACGAKESDCLCVQMARECDPDLCGSCGAIDILDPVNRYKGDLEYGRCCNVHIQRGVPKKTLLGHSEVHGFGLYTGEDVKRDEFIGEYKGEVVTIGEGERRDIIYKEQQTMYLFKLNRAQEIDATDHGNKTRFINNADKGNTNCYVKNLLCNTVRRIGVYAAKNVKAGTELYFYYEYPAEQTKGFKQPGGSSSRNIPVPVPSSSGPAQRARKSTSLNAPKRAPSTHRPEEVPETDTEDVWQADADASAEEEEQDKEKDIWQVDTEDEGLSALGASRRRQNNAPVVAVKQTVGKKKNKGKMGGARPGAGRPPKRKRQLDSDED